MTNRMRQLLLRAAKALDEGTDPFGTHFLAENHVTLDEANELADTVAQCIRSRVPSTEGITK